MDRDRNVLIELADARAHTLALALLVLRQAAAKDRAAGARIDALAEAIDSIERARDACATESLSLRQARERERIEAGR